MTKVAKQPTQGLERFRGGIESWFDNFFKSALEEFGWDKWLEERAFVPKVDISEDEKNYYVEVAAPGMSAENFDIEYSNGILTISGERKFEKEEKGKTYHRVETQYGKFSRSFTLPEDVISDKIEAEYKDGILRIVVPKDVKKIESKKIKIK